MLAFTSIRSLPSFNLDDIDRTPKRLSCSRNASSGAHAGYVGAGIVVGIGGCQLEVWGLNSRHQLKLTEDNTDLWAATWVMTPQQ